MDTRTSRIRALNDELRHTFTAGMAVVTPGIAALGKGSFNEIFFVDLPTAAERAESVNVQIKSHHLTASNFALKQVAAATDGFSSAEIEQLVTTVLLRSLQNKLKLSTESLLTETKLFVPLSKSRAEEIDKLRALGKARFRPAG